MVVIVTLERNSCTGVSLPFKPNPVVGLAIVVIHLRF